MTLGELVEGIVLWSVTGAMLLYGAVGTLVAWTERPMVGRDEYGRARAARLRRPDELERQRR